MIIGQGIDLVKVKRIKEIYEKFGAKFLYRIFSTKEIESFKSFQSSNKLLFFQKFATRFAAKEAAVKAIGTGFSKGIIFKDIEILKKKNGQPKLKFRNNALKQLKKNFQIKSKFTLNLSMSNEKNYAIAIVTISIY